MLLEQLRLDNLGETYAWFPEKGNDEGAMVLMTAPHYASQAFYQTLQSLEHLERSSESVLKGPTSLAAIGAWFLSLEAHINFSLKVACVAIGEDFANFKKKDVTSRIASLLEMNELEKTEFYKSGALSRVQEFLTTRNELFHDRHLDGELKFHHTKFSPVPYLGNQVDVLQAGLVAHEIFEAFRYIYSGLDLMPHVNVRRGGGGGFIKIDLLFDEVITPYLRECLKKHGLTTELNVVRQQFRFPESKLIQRGRVEILVRAMPKSELQFKANPTETNLGRRFFEVASNMVVIDNEDQFRLANYYRV